MGTRTPLYAEHLAMGARIVPFGGWDMPLHYGSQLEEHHAVRRGAGMFDVSHMTVVDLRGEKAQGFLQYVLANDVGRLKTLGKALYSCMLNENGGVIDDLIVYYMAPGWFRMVVNAATTEKDVLWLKQCAADYSVEVMPRKDLAMIAVQGPEARAKAAPLFPVGLRAMAEALKPFSSAEAGGWFVGRTGYTGEDGIEVVLPAAEAAGFWKGLAAAGVTPCGLGARDTLRLEAGMNLYGSDMDENLSPLESGLEWTVAWDPVDRDFVGRSALEDQKGNPELSLFVGLVLLGRGILRNHQEVYADGDVIGEITSGGYAPTLGRSIAFARIRRDPGGNCDVDIRGKRVPAKVVQPPFVRKGKACVDV